VIGLPAHPDLEYNRRFTWNKKAIQLSGRTIAGATILDYSLAHRNRLIQLGVGVVE